MTVKTGFHVMKTGVNDRERGFRVMKTGVNDRERGFHDREDLLS